MASIASAQQEPGWKAQGGLDLMLGQYFFNDSAGSVNGYAGADAQLLRSLSSDAGFYLDGRFVYTGFKQVNELAGGGTLFQQSMDTSLGAKYVKRWDEGWSLKPRVGVKSGLFRETKDEKWGKGLYDFTRYEGGLTLERKTRLGLSTPWIYQFSWDVYYNRYTRFKTLASQFGQELAAPNPGSRTLDTVTNQFSYDNEFDLPGFVRLDIFAALSIIGYQDQKIINSDGNYLSSKRSDSYQAFNIGLTRRYNDLALLGGVRPVMSVRLGLANNFSNQSHLDTDPAHLKFSRYYYDYWEERLSPGAQFTFIESGLVTRLGYEFAIRRYAGRLAQKPDGAYGRDKLAQYSGSLTTEAVYPLFHNLDVKLQGTWATSRSNNHYEQVYRYNYYSSMYFAGLEWRF